MSQNWYVRLPSGEVGPLLAQELKQLATSGKINSEDLVSQDRERWVPAVKVRGFSFDDAPGPMEASEVPVSSALRAPPQRNRELSKVTNEEFLDILYSGQRQLLWRRLAAWILDGATIFVTCVLVQVFLLALGSVALSRETSRDNFLGSLILPVGLGMMLSWIKGVKLDQRGQTSLF